MSSPPQVTHPDPTQGRSVLPAAGISPAGALVAAFSDTIGLLFAPFDATRWLKLSVICLFLGGGAASAALHWGLSALAGDTGYQVALEQLRAWLGQLPGLLPLSIVLALSLGVLVVYVRATCRFALVETILNREVLFRRRWKERRCLAHSYFFWLLGTLAIVGMGLGVGTLIVLPYLRAEAGSEIHSLAFRIMLGAFLLVQVAVGLVAGLIITLTDDLAVPIMYAKRLPFLAAWRELARMMCAEAGAFTLYFFLRLVVSVGIGVAVLFFLFPTLVAVLSAAIIVGAVVILMFRLSGVAWVWNPLTILLAALALSLLMGVLFVLLGLVGMPGQAFLQTFGMRFVSSRLPALQSLWPIPRFPSRQG